VLIASRFVAVEENAKNLPSSLIAGAVERPFAMPPFAEGEISIGPTAV
jgi:hypothetical protein